MDAWTPDDLKTHLDQGDSVFLKLWKKGCGICKLSTAATDKIEKDDSRGIKFAKICIDDHPEMMQVAGTEVLPVFFMFADKKKKGMVTGFKGLDKLQSFVDDCMKA